MNKIATLGNTTVWKRRDEEKGGTPRTEGSGKIHWSPSGEEEGVAEANNKIRYVLKLKGIEFGKVTVINTERWQKDQTTTSGCHSSVALRDPGNCQPCPSVRSTPGEDAVVDAALHRLPQNAAISLSHALFIWDKEAQLKWKLQCDKELLSNSAVCDFCGCAPIFCPPPVEGGAVVRAEHWSVSRSTPYKRVLRAEPERSAGVWNLVLQAPKTTHMAHKICQERWRWATGNREPALSLLLSFLSTSLMLCS